MKKIFFSIIGVLSLFLVACQGNNEVSTTAPVEPTVEEDSYKLKLATPGGAPAVSAAELLHTYKDEYIFNVGLAPQALAPLFSNKEYDVIVAPINMGAIQYSKNNNYVLGSVLTWGNLYLASQREGFKLEGINNNEFIYFGENSVNEAIILDIFEKKNITPSKLTALESTQLTQAKLISDSNAICLVAEPLLSVAMSKKPNITAISVQELFKEVSGQDGFAQAGAFIKVDTINEHKMVVNKFLTRLEASSSFASANPAKAAEYAKELEVTVPAPAKSIPNCNIKFTKAKACKSAIEYLVELNPKYFGGAKPIDAFYYEG